MYQLYAYTTAFFCKGLKHSWVLVSSGAMEPDSHRYQGTTILVKRCFRGNFKDSLTIELRCPWFRNFFQKQPPHWVLELLQQRFLKAQAKPWGQRLSWKQWYLWTISQGNMVKMLQVHFLSCYTSGVPLLCWKLATQTREKATGIRDTVVMLVIVNISREGSPFHPAGFEESCLGKLRLVLYSHLL